MMAGLIDDMCSAYVEKWGRRVEGYGATHLLHPGDPIQPSEDPQLDERGYFVDEEFEGLCRKLASELMGSQVRHRDHGRTVLVVTRVVQKFDGATIAATNKTVKVTDLGRHFEVLKASG